MILQRKTAKYKEFTGQIRGITQKMSLQYTYTHNTAYTYIHIILLSRAGQEMKRFEKKNHGYE